ncbi:MAG: GNAT family N-acetyltransferase [Firmicutes bacterium]|nr:GNAT family N-acetyltransferase [Bacillota bacterium]
MLERETERLIVRKFTKDDWKDLYDYLSIPEVVKYEPYDVFTKNDCIEEAKSRAYEQRDMFWAVCFKKSRKMIGHVYFAQLEPDELKTWTIGYVFNPKYYGNGYATEACKSILQYGFKVKNAHRIVAGVCAENKPSWKLLERLSMRKEAHFIKNIFFEKTSEGKPIWNDAYRYAMLSTEYDG